MNRLGRYKTTPSAALMWALTFICGAAFAQQKIPEKSALPPLPPPIYQPGELPSLPPPTEQQLQRGRELLDKIVYVIANAPLTDAAAVLKGFGFTDLRTKEYPTHADVGPKGKDSDFLSESELKGTGLSDVTVQPWIKDPRINATSWLSAAVVPEDTCISIDAVRRVFEPMASKIDSDRIVTIHPVPRPKPLHGIGTLSFASLQNPMNKEASITFAFEYQTCVERFSFIYQKSSKDGRQIKTPELSLSDFGGKFKNIKSYVTNDALSLINKSETMKELIRSYQEDTHTQAVMLDTENPNSASYRVPRLTEGRFDKSFASFGVNRINTSMGFIEAVSHQLGHYAAEQPGSVVANARANAAAQTRTAPRESSYERQ